MVKKGNVVITAVRVGCGKECVVGIHSTREGKFFVTEKGNKVPFSERKKK